MEQKKQEVINQLKNLSSIKVVRPTAMDLHSSRAMLGRVQRKEDKRYYNNIEIQKAKLKKQLKNIEDYSKSVGKRKEYLSKAPKVLPIQKFDKKMNKFKGNNSEEHIQSMKMRNDYLRETPVLLQEPVLKVYKKPIRKSTRFNLNKRRGRY